MSKSGRGRATVCATVLLGLIAVAHALRILWRIEVTAGGRRIPMGVSWAALLVAGVLSFALWREGRHGESGPA
jgi:hypothetical protein